jgi:hypothetical protein
VTISLIGEHATTGPIALAGGSNPPEETVGGLRVALGSAAREGSRFPVTLFGTAAACLHLPTAPLTGTPPCCRPPHPPGPQFVRGGRDEFSLEAEDVGRVLRIDIGHDNRWGP